MITPLAQHQRTENCWGRYDRTDQVFDRIDRRMVIMIWQLNVLIAMMVVALLLVH